MIYSIDNFTKVLKQLLYERMPLSSEEEHARKHPNRNFHMRDLALGNNVVIPLGTDSQYFEIGNDDSEEKAPYYHILQDAQVIRKAGQGTKKTKGSQAYVKDPRKRDYGQVTYKVSTSKTGRKRVQAYYEYRRNVRGKRSLIGKATRKFVNENGEVVTLNRESKYYANIHFDYIGRNLDDIVKILAQEFNLRLGYKNLSKTNYDEEYAEQMES